MKKILFIFSCLLLTACATPTSGKKDVYDYTELKKSQPKSILLVMPVNNSVDVKAETSVLAQATIPLAELGYYVFPVVLVDDIFQQNGVMNGQDIRAVNSATVHKIFGADAIMYLDVEEYGSSYRVFDSQTKVVISGKLVDLRTGITLWDGKATAMDSSHNSNDSLLVTLVKAAVVQIINTINDNGYKVSGLATKSLFYYGRNGGLLHGPRYIPKEKK